MVDFKDIDSIAVRHSYYYKSPIFIFIIGVSIFLLGIYMAFFITPTLFEIKFSISDWSRARFAYFFLYFFVMISLCLAGFYITFRVLRKEFVIIFRYRKKVFHLPLNDLDSQDQRNQKIDFLKVKAGSKFNHHAHRSAPPT